jgi:hypothetical protein
VLMDHVSRDLPALQHPVDCVLGVGGSRRTAEKAGCDGKYDGLPKGKIFQGKSSVGRDDRTMRHAGGLGAGSVGRRRPRWIRRSSHKHSTPACNLLVPGRKFKVAAEIELPRPVRSQRRYEKSPLEFLGFRGRSPVGASLMNTGASPFRVSKLLQPPEAAQPDGQSAWTDRKPGRFETPRSPNRQGGWPGPGVRACPEGVNAPDVTCPSRALRSLCQSLP